MANAIKWIAHRAKQIKRAHPRKHTKWAGYVAEASADYRRSHKAHKAKPAKKRTHKPRRAPRRRAGSVRTSSRSHTDKNRITANIQVGALGKVSAGSLEAELRRRIRERIDRAVVRKYHATKKRDRARIQKEISKANQELRRLK